MLPSTIRWLYLVLVLVDLFWGLFLTWLNYRNVGANEGEVPAPFRGVVAPEEHAKASAYSRARMRAGALETAIMAALGLACVLSGLFGLLDRAILGLLPVADGAASSWQAFLRCALFLGAVMLGSGVAGLPFSLHSTFVLEKRFGFNTTSLRTWLLDVAKGLLVSVLLGLPLLWLLLAFMATAGSLWWLWAAGIFSVISVLLSLVFPLVVAPLFNKFSPLPEGSLRSGIEDLARRLEFGTKGIFVMDGSRRSRHSNAYFTGLGRLKRIVLFDTLVESMEEAEVLAVLAHEIGHEKRRHVLKMTAVSVASSFFGFWVLSLLMDWPALYAAFGFVHSDGVRPLVTREAILLVFGLLSGPATFFLTPLFSLWSRRHEYEADRFAVEAAGADAMAGALLRLNRENASNLAPHPLYSFWYYSHPALAERLAAIRGGKRP